ncbi:hypothetical protein ALT721_2100038 [Alteromonas alvinellae]
MRGETLSISGKAFLPFRFASFFNEKNYVHKTHCGALRWDIYLIILRRQAPIPTP